MALSRRSLGAEPCPLSRVKPSFCRISRWLRPVRFRPGVTACYRLSGSRVSGSVGQSWRGRRSMRRLLGLSVVLAVAQVAHAAYIEAGKRMATTGCAACHGANGASVSDVIPNLAAQRAGYIGGRLKAFKDGARPAQGAVSPTANMDAMASQLNAEDIANVAAYFAAQPGA